MSNDIGEILRSWEFDPDSIIIRKIDGDDGKEKIQIRINLGILQMEMDGRPDGKESMLDYYDSLIEQSKRIDGTTETFVITEKDMREIDIEIMQYYQRRICFFALNEYIGAKKDAEHNLHLMDIIKNYCKDKEYIDSHEQYRPFVIMERTRAAGLECLKDQDYATAMEYINNAMEMISNFYKEYRIDEEDIEKRHELVLLRKWREKIHQDWEGGITDIGEEDFIIQ